MWDRFKHNISNMGQIALTGLFCLAVFVLVLIHVFGLGSADIKKLFASNSKQSETQAKKPDAKVKPKVKPKLKIGEKPKFKSGSKVVNKVVGNEVRQYSEFVTVKHPTLMFSISTGIRYDNSTNQKIVAQWCYAQKRKSKNDGLSAHLTIRELKNGKFKSFAPYSVQTLREFGLTQSQAKNLNSYCRFK